mmetsp:Transcript_45046/g.75781  ORF Transcript_45046/g.75781 Transcript_45046/m.75781 type:complete len:207 (-) Transcript_45046:574-1194(-)
MERGLLVLWGLCRAVGEGPRGGEGWRAARRRPPPLPCEAVRRGPGGPHAARLRAARAGGRGGRHRHRRPAFPLRRPTPSPGRRVWGPPVPAVRRPPAPERRPPRPPQSCPGRLRSAAAEAAEGVRWRRCAPAAGAPSGARGCAPSPPGPSASPSPALPPPSGGPGGRRAGPGPCPPASPPTPAGNRTSLRGYPVHRPGRGGSGAAG